MKINILTLFPEMFSALNCSILKRAIDKGIIEINLINIRDFSESIHKKCDDYSFGGGAGMVMTPQPIVSAIASIDNYQNIKKVFMSPQGSVLSHKKAVELSKLDEIIILCGHYEGVDERVIEFFIDEEISVGDYVLTGGELAAMVLVDSFSRQIDGVIDSESLLLESHENKLLEYPQYTRPQDFMGYKVPEILISGNHQKIEKWRTEMRVEVTRKKRPDLLD